jgi:hypothetical protein
MTIGPVRRARTYRQSRNPCIYIQYISKAGGHAEEFRIVSSPIVHISSLPTNFLSLGFKLSDFVDDVAVCSSRASTRIDWRGDPRCGS